MVQQVCTVPGGIAAYTIHTFKYYAVHLKLMQNNTECQLLTKKKNKIKKNKMRLEKYL